MAEAAARREDRGGARVDALYNLMQSFENKLGGGEGVEGLYGSITQNSMQKVLDCMKRNCGLDQRSEVVDIGAGLGRPLLHAMVAAGVGAAWGVELDRVKCDKAAAFCEHVVRHMVEKELLAEDTVVPSVRCSPIEKVDTLDPSTHAYSFWEGVPTSGKRAFGALFKSSKSLRAVAVVQRAMRGQQPAAVMHELGFGPVLLISTFPVKMSGSGRSFTAYVFSKIAPAAAGFLAGAAPAAAAGEVGPACEAAADEAERRRGGGGAGSEASSSGRTERRPADLAAGRPDDAAPSLSPRARKSEAEATPPSPPKRPCSASGLPADAAADAQAAGRQVEGAAAEPAQPAGARRPLAPLTRRVQQQALTSIPAFSRRTKEELGAAAKAKAAGGVGQGGLAATRSSSRLAAQKLAAGAADTKAR